MSRTALMRRVPRAFRPRNAPLNLVVTDADKVPRTNVPTVDLQRVEDRYRKQLENISKFTSALVAHFIIPQLDSMLPAPDEGEDDAPELKATDAHSTNAPSSGVTARTIEESLKERDRIRELSKPLVRVNLQGRERNEFTGESPASGEDPNELAGIQAPPQMFERWIIRFTHNGKVHTGSVVSSVFNKKDRKVHYTWKTTKGKKIITVGVPPDAIRTGGFRRNVEKRKVTRAQQKSTGGPVVPESERIDRVSEDMQYIRDAVQLSAAGQARILAAKTASTSERAHKPQQVAQLKASVGVGIDLYRETPKLDEITSGFTFTNTRLIVSIPEQQLNRVEDLVNEAVRQGRSVRALQKDLFNEFDISEGRALLIARDQIGKIQSNLSKHRQVANGVTHAIWRDSDDEKVRKRHAAFDGTVFSWAEGINGVFPGQEVGCRCDAEPVGL